MSSNRITRSMPAAARTGAEVPPPEGAAPLPRGLPISWKLTMLILGTVLLVLGVGIFVVARSGIRTLEENLLDKVNTSARVVGDYSVSDLAFRAHDESRRTLESLAEDADLVFAVIYDDQGRPFSSYVSPRSPESSVSDEPLEPPDSGHAVQMTAEHIEVLYPITRDGVRYGSIRVRASTRALDRRVAQYWWTVAGVASGLIVMALVLAAGLQRVISRPLFELAKAARAVSQSRDTSLRVQPMGGREFVMLAEGFNQMLAALERRQGELDASMGAQRRYADRLRILHDIDGAILSEWTIEQTARQALVALRHVVPFVSSALLTFDRGLQEGRVAVRWPAPQDGEEEPRPVDLLQQRALLNQLTAGAMMVIRAADAGEPATAALLDALQIRDFDVVVAVPMYTENTLLGALVLVDAAGAPDAKEPLVVAHEVAELLALSLYQADLTRQVRLHTESLEARVAERTAALEASNRELEAFGYSVAHDLRAPLRAMQGYASILLEELGDSAQPTTREYLSRIMDSSTRMDELIHDLLDYSQLSLNEMPLVPVSLEAVVRHSLDHLAHFLDQHRAEVVTDEAVGRVSAHKGTLSQILQNLVTNAVKFAADGVAPRVVIRAEPRGEVTRIWVEDNGIGIAVEHRERIFRIFQRLHGREDYPGTGIGLAIVKKGAERMGGQAGLESEPGRGSRFWIELRCAT